MRLLLVVLVGLVLGCGEKDDPVSQEGGGEKVDRPFERTSGGVIEFFSRGASGQFFGRWKIVRIVLFGHISAKIAWSLRMLDSIAAFPSNPGLKERERMDGVKPGLYKAMHDRGELLLLGDKVVPVAELLSAATERLGYPDAIACDRWRLGELHDGMTTAALLAPVTPCGMGFKDGSEDVLTAVGSWSMLRTRRTQSECRAI